MLGCKAIDNPVEQNKKLGKSDESSLVYIGRYQRLVERHLDNTYANNVVSQFMPSPREYHMEAVFTEYFDI